MTLLLRWSLVLLWVAGGVPSLATEALELGEWRLRVGDDAGWAAPALDDSEWAPTDFWRPPQDVGIVWMRTTTRLSPEAAGRRPLAVIFEGMAASEIWWDGERIGAGGRVGATAAEEIPGPISVLVPIPDRLATPGEHVVALRLSMWHRGFRPKSGLWRLWVGPYASLLRSGVAYAHVAVIGLSGLVMMAVFALLMFALEPRERSYLFLALLCLAGAALLVAESWRPLFGYPYDRHLWRLIAVTALAWLVDVMLLVFLARKFPAPGARWFVGLGILLATVPIFASRSWDPKVAWGFVLVFPMALLWALYAAVRRMPGGVLTSAGLGVCCVLVLVWPYRFVERNLYFGLNVLVICLLISHALHVRRVRGERQAAQLKSARLELALLKKQLQPHFLMNTLTALSEWVEEDPAVASRMIQSLADEFRLLSGVSDRRLIRMEDELRLCRSHLEIMSCRKGRRYRLEVDGVDGSAAIPPAVFHTLVENAITHDRHDGPEVTFRLAASSSNGQIAYRFEAPLGPAASKTPDAPVEGTGLRYVRARLQESFGDAWRLSNGAAGHVWRTEIRVPAEAVRS